MTKKFEREVLEKLDKIHNCLAKLSERSKWHTRILGGFFLALLTLAGFVIKLYVK